MILVGGVTDVFTIHSGSRPYVYVPNKSINHHIDMAINIPSMIISCTLRGCRLPPDQRLNKQLILIFELCPQIALPPGD